MNRQIYVHYGSMQFDPTKRFPIRNERHWSKPHGGLWASRKNATFGWKNWCIENEFKKCDVANSFEFTMKDEDRVVVINTLAQLRRLPKVESGITIWSCIDFEKCLRLGIDAIELCWYGDEYQAVANGDLHFELYRWDCDSIVVLNPNAIVQR